MYQICGTIFEVFLRDEKVLTGEDLDDDVPFRAYLHGLVFEMGRNHYGVPSLWFYHRFPHRSSVLLRPLLAVF